MVPLNTSHKYNFTTTWYGQKIITLCAYIPVSLSVLEMEGSYISHKITFFNDDVNFVNVICLTFLAC